MNQHGRLRIEICPDMMFQQNCLLVWIEGASDCWLIDPGFPPSPDRLVTELRERSLNPAAIVLTHCHVDHIAGINAVRAAYPEIPIVAPRDEAHMLTDPQENLSERMGFPVVAPETDHLVAPGDTLKLADVDWRVLDVSGHSPGGLAYYSAAVGVVIGGDALFCGSIGRYDFHNSSRERLLRNIQAQLLTLPEETVLYSGHGPITTIGNEKKHNRVLKAELADASFG